MRKPTKKSLTRKLDRICSEIVRSRGVCAKCGNTDFRQLETAHIFSRTYRNTRWDLLNLLCLCKACHFSAHKNPVFFTEWLKSHLGLINYTLLKERAKSIKKWALQDMEDYYNALKEERDEKNI